MSSFRVITADALDGLAMLAAGSVQTVVTSPPYWGLRDYGTAEWSGGDPFHEHAGRTWRTAPAGTPKQASNRGSPAVRSGDCSCGAVRSDRQVGLEATPSEYVDRLVAVFGEVRRVLRNDGTIWLNLGDTYASQGGHAGNGSTSQRQGRANLGAENRGAYSTVADGLKPKDLVGIPWRVAFALQADGWFLRADIVWAKPNPMPESVTDRPTRSHEFVFLLSSSGRYYYDADAVREPALRVSSGNGQRSHGADHGRLDLHGAGLGSSVPWTDDGTGRNLRDVWTVTADPFPGAHFATMPKALATHCILAGSRPGDLVLDPFCGAGTTGVVALREDRDFVGIELAADFAQMARDRIWDDGPLWNQEAP